MDVSQAAINDGFKLLVALAFIPIVLRIGRNVRMRDAAKPFLIGIAALVGSFALSFVSRQFGLSAVQWLRWTRHLSVGLAGFAFAWAAWQLRKHEITVPGGQR